MNSLCKTPAVIASRTYSCISVPVLDAPLVLIHGWANDGQIWDKNIAQFRSLSSVIVIDLPGFGLSPVVGGYSLETLLKLLHQALPAKCHVVGWSLGAMLAMQLAERFSNQVKSLLLLACNAKFVASKDWPAAMPEQTFQSFQNNFDKAPIATVKKFQSLQTLFDIQAKEKLKRLRLLQTDISITSNWSGGLELLAAIDLRSSLSRLSTPTLMVFGESDQLVPLIARQAIDGICSKQVRTTVVKGCGHLLPWLKGGDLNSLLWNFYQFESPVQAAAPTAAILGNSKTPFTSRRMVNDSYQLDKKKIAASFSNAANSYDDFAQIQRNIGQQLLQRIPHSLSVDDSCILDLGCGTGYFSEILQQQCQGQVVGLDLAEGMVQFARQKRPNVNRWLCADAEFLPLATKSLDGVFSSLAVQWCQQPQQLLAEFKRVLKPGAWAAIATLGPTTLCELRQSWAEVDDKVHVNQFIDQNVLLAAAKTVGFTSVKLECKTELMQYRQLSELTRELKSLGANNRNPGQGSGLQSRKDLLKLKQSYEVYRGRHGAESDKLPASYQVYYITLQA